MTPAPKPLTAEASGWPYRARPSVVCNTDKPLCAGCGQELDFAVPGGLSVQIALDGRMAHQGCEFPERELARLRREHAEIAASLATARRDATDHHTAAVLAREERDRVAAARDSLSRLVDTWEEASRAWDACELELRAERDAANARAEKAEAALLAVVYQHGDVWLSGADVLQARVRYSLHQEYSPAHDAFLFRAALTHTADAQGGEETKHG